MTSVSFKKDLGNIVSVNIKDHSGYGDNGEDVVCSAISAISLTIANGITEVLKIKAKCDAVDGFLLIDLKGCSEEEIEKCQVLMETMLLGLKSIELNYGDYIKVEVEEV